MYGHTRDVGHVFDSYQRAKQARVNAALNVGLERQDSKRIGLMVAIALGLVLAALVLCSSAYGETIPAPHAPAVTGASYGARAMTLTLMVPFAGMLAMGRRRGLVGGPLMVICVVTVLLALGSVVTGPSGAGRAAARQAPVDAQMAAMTMQ